MNDTTFSGNGKVSFIPVITNTTPQPQTNADRIRAMTDEELAWWISDVQYIQRDPAEWEMWLKSPVEVDDG